MNKNGIGMCMMQMCMMQCMMQISKSEPSKDEGCFMIFLNICRWTYVKQSLQCSNTVERLGDS